MDKLAELEEKKKQLKELRERRSYGNGKISIDHLLQSIQYARTEEKGSAVTVSVQTDVDKEVIRPQEFSYPGEQQAATRHVITCDKMVQTAAIPTDELSITKQKEGDGHSNIDVRESPLYDKKIDLLAPLLMEDQQNTVQIKSFSIQEVLNESFPGDKSLLTGNSKFVFSSIHRWNAELDPQPGAGLQPVSLDSFGNLVAVVFQSIPVDRFNVLMTPWSYLIIFKWDALQVVDKVEFRGQIITKAKFLRKDVASDVVSILATSHTGKTILYELRCVEGSNLSKKLERNVISQNVFASTISGFDEYRNVPKGHERFIAASISGVLNELSALDLSIYSDATSCNPPLSNIKVVPPRPSELVVLGADEDEEEKSDCEARSNTGEKLFRHHLLKVSLFDNLAITAISLSPSDSQCVYVGTEDGGIYRLHLKDVVDGSIKVRPTNNGFLPINDIHASDDSVSMFHSSHVSSLSHNGDELMLSASLDWTCILWSPFDATKLNMIDMGSPIIDAAWLEGENHLCCILTWDLFSIVQWKYHCASDSDALSNNWQSTTLPKVVCQLSSDEASCGNFTCFKNFKNNDLDHIFAIGCDDQEVRFYRMPSTD